MLHPTARCACGYTWPPGRVGRVGRPGVQVLPGRQGQYMSSRPLHSTAETYVQKLCSGSSVWKIHLKTTTFLLELNCTIYFVWYNLISPKKLCTIWYLLIVKKTLYSQHIKESLFGWTVLLWNLILSYQSQNMFSPPFRCLCNLYNRKQI